MRKIILEMDGDYVCARWDDFIDLQTSPVGYGDAVKRAVLDLLENSDKSVLDGTV